MRQAILDLQSSRSPKTLSLERSEFTTILEAIDNQCRTYERTPTAAGKLNETDYRDFILGMLNGSFDVTAVGDVLQAWENGHVACRARWRVFIRGMQDLAWRSNRIRSRGSDTWISDVA